MEYLLHNPGYVALLFLQHLRLTGEVLGISLLIAIPLGVLLNRVNWLHGPTIGILSIIYTIPSLSLLVLLIPFFGLGTTSAIIALVAYSQILLVRNWVIGLSSIDPSIIEAAKGMGMNSWQRFWQIELPLATPLLLAGVRLSVLSTIGIGTIAAYINAGGLGTLLFEGVVTGNNQKIFAGSLAVSFLAISANYLLHYLERRSEKALRGPSNR